MVQILRKKPVAVFRVFDRDGRAIGEVIQPRAEPEVGRGARTLLLVRGIGGSQNIQRCKTLLTA